MVAWHFIHMAAWPFIHYGGKAERGGRAERGEVERRVPATPPVAKTKRPLSDTPPRAKRARASRSQVVSSRGSGQAIEQRKEDNAAEWFAPWPEDTKPYSGECSVLWRASRAD